MIKKSRNLVVSSLHHQAKQIKTDSILKNSVVSIGTNVMLPAVPDVDRTRSLPHF